MIKSPRDPKEAKVLIRLECGILVCMFTMQLSVLVLTFVVHSCWVKEYKGLEVEREEMTKKRSRKMARVQEESMENVTKLAEARTKELDEKMKNKYGQWTKTDFEG
ncbi:hypothetical protein GIB67_008873 [Kingdonia uniflora]|uniref:Uncharacterized protein n=1 Tax=Kingdonia uniflora TaxID=39325 RepID=A0A7J7LVI3_9MAGN|nr:hypothetical protein GIB67_008873 [Kingdonia uniflora]